MHTLRRVIAILTSRQVERLVKLMEKAQDTGYEVVVEVKFTRGHPKDLIVTDHELLTP